MSGPGNGRYGTGPFPHTRDEPSPLSRNETLHGEASQSQAQSRAREQAQDQSQSQSQSQARGVWGESSRRVPSQGGLLRGQVVVIAREPVSGKVRSRLTPPFTEGEAAALAAAALEDTLRAVARVPIARRVLALDGAPGPWLPHGFTVLPQRGNGPDERLAAAFDDAHRLLPGPVVLIGMDTPQVTPDMLVYALSLLGAYDAVFGPAADGGFWLLGLRVPDPALLLGVPMSEPTAGEVQLRRLGEAGLSVALMPRLTDVDTAADAFVVAAQAPRSFFAAALARMSALR
ncbi:TIGR04282 family arsenosugar biosynthesis glycosyltransferase [Streptosporangium sp. V21-05]|uniref:TIGR04282 family arsenosugar biosynthesis glycosyltransferase n=1 Tax=Streptosporangium sp. V21-05 TaxID=3446115 RepID=UPI003F52C34A